MTKILQDELFDYKKEINKFPEKFIFNANAYPLEAGTSLIQASAGTGKTFALGHICLRLITEKKLRINELLVVTFTEAAAAELKERITSRLESALAGLKTDDKSIGDLNLDSIMQNWLTNSITRTKRTDYIYQILEALDSIDSSDITTIHGFCKRTLDRESLTSGSLIEPLIEGENNELLLEVIHDYWQKEILTLQPDQLRGILDAGFQVDKLAQIIKRIDENPSLSLPSEVKDIKQNTSLLVQLNEFIAENWKVFKDLWAIEGKKLEEGLRRFAQECRNNAVTDTKPFSPKPIKDRHQILSDWINSYSIGIDKNIIPTYYEIRKQNILSKYYHPGVFLSLNKRIGDDNISLISNNLQNSIASLYDGPAERVWNHAIEWISKELFRRRSDKGIMNYSDLLKALDPEKKSVEVNESLLSHSLKKRYKAILIDEFQDTDPIQWRLLKETFGNSSSHILIMVGDPKQAIYKFRGSDLDTYLEAKKSVKRLDELLDNYRTTPVLMDGLNIFFSKGLRNSSLSVPSLNPKAIEDRKNINAKHLLPFELIILDEEKNDYNFSGGEPLAKGKIEELIPPIVAGVTNELISTKENSTNAEDICIIVNNHKQAEKIRSQLSKSNIPSKLITQGDILQSEASIILQRFIDCLAEPGNTNYLKLLACSGLIEWNPINLNSSQLNKELDILAERFLSWSKKLTSLGLLGCLSELLEGKVIADLSKRGRLLGDIYQCAQIIQEVIHLEGLDAHQASKWLKTERLFPIEPVPENRQPHSDLTESAVNVVTIHRSKGLEYKIVICPYLWESPPTSKGPLWKSAKEPNWLISINTNWGKGKAAKEEFNKSAFEEAERLTYVACTRARSRLILFWAKGLNQENNALSQLIISHDNQNNSELTPEDVSRIIKNNQIPISIRSSAEIKTNIKQKDNNEKHYQFSIGPKPSRMLESDWNRSSYSSWITNKTSSPYLIKNALDITNEQDKVFTNNKELNQTIESGFSLRSSPLLTKESPLKSFPIGPIAGECLHKILERLDFTKPLNDPLSEEIITEELLLSGLDLIFLKCIQESLEGVLNFPLGGPLKNFSFNQIDRRCRLSELSFDLPIAHKGSPISSRDILKAFSKNPDKRYGKNYLQRLSEINIHTRGFLTGSIDLVFIDNKDPKEGRWWVTDWKSNWIGTYDNEGKPLNCGPSNYTRKEMDQQMIHHHYPLQAHLYLVALHRFLKWRLNDYSPRRNLGGYIYCFLRGVPTKNNMSNTFELNESPGIIIEEAPIGRILEIDSILREGGK